MTWNGRRFDWVNVAWFTALHLGALAAPWTFTGEGLAMALGLWWLSGSIGIGVTYHRLLTHRSFRLPKPFEYLGTLAGMLASEGGAVSWVAMHRLHHAKSDVPGGDLHTPKEGFWWSHIGWVLCRTGLARRELQSLYAPELLADPVHRALERIHWLPNLVIGLLLFVLGGWSLLVWGGCVRVLLTLHATWLVNSATHRWGYRVWRTKDDSRNLWWVGLLAWGEGWHNTHHAFQSSARHGFGWELDTNWLAIRTLAAIGLASNVRLLPPNADRYRIRAETGPPVLEDSPASA